MLDKRTEMMLQVAATLSAEDLDYVRGMPPGVGPPERRPRKARGETLQQVAASAVATVVAAASEAQVEATTTPKPATATAQAASSPPGSSDPSRGARERQRTRESKVSTACIGQPRTGHAWWPVDTELEGRIGNEVFTATVVENSQVKSNRSVLITSGPAQGRVCITPTRAAIEATEEYRRIASLGRGGGVTNGWSFWKPKQ
jgi:hypothetical protein